MPATARYSIGDLATLGGVSRRTVRYYVQECLIPAPLGRGRGQHYDERHLKQLLRVKDMQEGGRTLDDIRRALGQKEHTILAARLGSEEQPVPRSLWRRMPLAPGVELHIASTIRLPSPSKLRELAEWCHRYFATDANGENEKDEDDND